MVVKPRVELGKTRDAERPHIGVTLVEQALDGAVLPARTCLDSDAWQGGVSIVNSWQVERWKEESTGLGGFPFDQGESHVNDFFLQRSPFDSGEQSICSLNTDSSLVDVNGRDCR